MMKRFIYNLFKTLAVGGVLMASAAGCTDKFDEYNRDKTALTVVGPKEMAGMFSTTQCESQNWVSSDNGNRMRASLTAINSGYDVSLGLTYDRYNQNMGWQNSGWEVMWKNAFVPCLRLIKLTEPESAERGVAVTHKVYITHQITDMWGPIPYDDAGNPMIAFPKYESQRTVYYKMFEELRLAADYMKKALDKNPQANAYGAGDMVWGGKVDTWYRFCNTLRLRLALRISNIEPAKAKQEGEAALATGKLLETNEHDGWMAIESWNNNPNNGMCRHNSWYAQGMTNHMESYMVGYEDPRVKEFWRPVIKGVDDDGVTCVTDDFPPELLAKVGLYKGLPSGLPQIFAINSIKVTTSRYGYRWSASKGPTQPINYVNAAETWFLKAEAAVKGWAHVGNSVEECYHKGIEVSMKQWVANITATQISEYIQSGKLPSKPSTDFTFLGAEFPNYNDPPVASVPVKLSSNNNEKMEQIFIQKWIATYPICIEAFSELRRNRLPKLYARKVSDNPNILVASKMMQTRCQFPEGEKNANRDQVAAAVGLLGKGGSLNSDLENVPLWWDVHTNGSVTPGNFSSEPVDPIANWNPIDIWER